MSTQAKPTGGANNGFFGFLGSIGDSLAKTVDTFLPVWTAKELGMQSQDQLRNPLYDARFGSQRLGDIPTTSGEPVAQKTSNSIFGVSFGGVHVGGVTIIMVAAAALGSIYLLKRG